MSIAGTTDLALTFSNGALNVVLGLLSLGGGWPEVDGRVFRNAPFETRTDATGGTVAVYDLGTTGRMEVRISIVPTGGTVRYTLRNVAPQSTIRRFGMHFDAVAGMKRFYRSGYHSWDGSYFVQPDALGAFSGPELTIEKSFGVTELIPGDGRAALIAGFDRHDRYQQTFTFGARRNPMELSVTTLWDAKIVPEGGDLASETLHLLCDTDYEEGLRRWARIVAGASPTPPRSRNTPLIGWGTWYNFYGFINEPLVRHTLESVHATATREALPLRTFLIDAGFTPELGDWLQTSFAFPNGVTPLIAAIKGAGYTPALWIAPHLVGNRSQLFREHPDWVLTDAVTGRPKLWAAYYGEQRAGAMRSEEYYVLDTTVPEAFEYLRTVFRTWRRDWGVEAFKVDFSFLGAEYGPEDVRFRTPGLTRIEVWRRFAEMVREEIGEDALWMGSGQPLWASTGLADTIRIAGDVGATWYGNGASAEPLLRDLPFRNFANHILWQIDPDAVLLRTRFHYLTDTEVRSLALLAGMSGGVMMTSDDLGELTPARIDLLRSLISAGRVTAAYPRFGRDEIVYLPFQVADGQPPVPVAFTEPVLVQVRKLAEGAAVVHITNTSAQSRTRTYSMSDLGIEGQRFVSDWFQPLPAPEAQKAVTQIALTLEGHASSLLYLTPAAANRIPGKLAGDP